MGPKGVSSGSDECGGYDRRPRVHTQGPDGYGQDVGGAF